MPKTKLKPPKVTKPWKAWAVMKPKGVRPIFIAKSYGEAVYSKYNGSYGCPAKDIRIVRVSITPERLKV